MSAKPTLYFFAMHFYLLLPPRAAVGGGSGSRVDRTRPNNKADRRQRRAPSRGRARNGRRSMINECVLPKKQSFRKSGRPPPVCRAFGASRRCLRSACPPSGFVLLPSAYNRSRALPFACLSNDYESPSAKPTLYFFAMHFYLLLPHCARLRLRGTFFLFVQKKRAALPLRGMRRAQLQGVTVYFLSSLFSSSIKVLISLN